MLARWLEGNPAEPTSKPADAMAALEKVIALFAPHTEPQKVRPPEVQAALDTVASAFAAMAP